MTGNSGSRLSSLLGGAACLLISLGACVAFIAGLVTGDVLAPKSLSPDGSGGYYSLSSAPLAYWLTLAAWLCCAALLAIYGMGLLKSRR